MVKTMGYIDRKSDSPAMQAYYDGTGKHPGGKPSLYNPEINKRALEYLNSYQDNGDVIPSIVGLAQVINIRRETLHVWANHEDKKEFANILKQIVEKQEQVLLNKGLTGDFNSNIAKLVLGKHGYHDKQELSAQIETKKVGDNELARRLAYVLAKGVTVEHED